MVLLPQPHFSLKTAVIFALPRSSIGLFPENRKLQHYSAPAKLYSHLQ